MPQSVSVKFSNAQDSPANLPVAKVQLVLGNYASAAAFGATVTSSGDDPSGNYPASGAIDGDRTELNVGPASGADNSVGKSSWRSSGISGLGDPTWLTINFNTSRTVNMVKIYLLADNLLKGVLVSYWNGSTWVPIGQANTPIDGAGNLIGLISYEFPDVTTTQLRFDALGTLHFNDHANIVEIEVYRKIDITSRVKGIKISRQRDYKLANPMAATVQLDCINTDRFFSVSHVPTATEIAAGFVNQELRPNLPILVSFGFNLYGAMPELVPAIAARLDSITPNPRARECKISGRDGMKALINQVDSTNLKTNIDIAESIRYILNRGNISNYEMNLADTSIVLPYFFTDQEDHLTTIRDLTQAAGDAIFYFDESGVATFQFHTGALPLSFIYPVQADWPTGTFTGNMVTNGSDQLALTVQHTTPKVSNNSGFRTASVVTSPNNSMRVIAQSFQLPYDTTLTNVFFKVYYQVFPATPTNATFKVWADNGGTPSATVLYSTTISTPVAGPNQPLVVNVSPALSLSAGIYWYGLSMTDTISIASAIEEADVNFTTPAQTAPTLPAPYQFTLSQATNSTVWAQAISHSPPIGSDGFVRNLGTYTFAKASGSGTWTSQVRDLGAGVTAYAPLQVVSTLNGNTVTYLTRSSSDGVHFSGFVPTAANGQPLSPVARYFQVQVSMTQSFLSGVSATVSELEINWTGGVGARRFPAAPSSFTFDYNSNLIDVSQELADNLGGDTSILNNISVQASPLLLTGNNSDTVWQGTVGVPPVNISASAPLTVTAGIPITVAPYISGGMDTSRMSGANPAAAVVTFGGGAAGTWTFTRISLTLPVLVITPTVSGTITDLRLTGKAFSSQSVEQAATATSASSIQNFGDRRQNITNKWIITSQIAQVIANNLLANFKDPFSYIPSFTVQPTFSAQVGDRVTVHDVNLDVNDDYVIVGLDHNFAVQGDTPAISTTGKLLAIPTGL